MSEALREKLSVGHNYFVANYPPFPAWTADAIPGIEAAFDREPRPGVPLGIYVHIPFCRKRCHFCYYKVYTEKSAHEVSQYVDAVHRELAIQAARPAVHGRQADFVYFGGGTPSYLSGDELYRLAEGLQAVIPWREGAEITFECEPGTLRLPKVKALKALGVTRLSLGVESFEQSILEANGRAHGERHIEPAFQMCRDEGFDQINIDLIAGMLGENDESWNRGIERTIALQPDSVTIYQMEVPGNTTLFKNLKAGDLQDGQLASWSQKREWVRRAFERLGEAGYSFSSGYTAVKSRDTSFGYRDNLWRGSDLLGVGVSAFGHLNGVHVQNDKHIESYIRTVLEGRLPLQRGFVLTEEERMTREWVLQLKLGVVQFEYFIRKFGVNPGEVFSEELAAIRNAGLADYDEHRVSLTRAGLLRVDTILPIFFAKAYQ